jgi:hypothetical protein
VAVEDGRVCLFLKSEAGEAAVRMDKEMAAEVSAELALASEGDWEEAE